MTQDLERAGRYYQLGCDAAREAGLLSEVARALTNLGGIHHAKRQFGAALDCQVQSEQLAREIGDLRILWYAIRGQSSTLEMIQDYRGSLERNLTGARVADEAGLPDQAHQSRVWAACDFLDLYQPQEALEILEAESLFKPMTAFGEAFAAFAVLLLACAYGRMGNQTRARQCLKQAESLTAWPRLAANPNYARWIGHALSEIEPA
jgi:tetratricopeptide (TPR) repeat protein